MGLEPTSGRCRHLFSRQAPDPAGWLPATHFVPFPVPGAGIEPAASAFRARRHYQQQLPRNELDYRLPRILRQAVGFEIFRPIKRRGPMLATPGLGIPRRGRGGSGVNSVDGANSSRARRLASYPDSAGNPARSSPPRSQSVGFIRRTIDRRGKRRRCSRSLRNSCRPGARRRTFIARSDRMACASVSYQGGERTASTLTPGRTPMGTGGLRSSRPEVRSRHAVPGICPSGPCRRPRTGNPP